MNKASHETCPPVEEFFGDSETARELMATSDQGAEEVARDIATSQRDITKSDQSIPAGSTENQIRSEHDPNEIDSTRKRLGCISCEAELFCLVNKELMEIEANERAHNIVGMLQGAPRWLQLARASRYGEKDFSELSRNKDDLERLITEGRVKPSELLTKVENELIAPVLASELPELKGLVLINPDAPLELHEVKCLNTGVKAEVIDARIATFLDKNERLGIKDEKILYKKLLEKLEATDKDRNSTLLTPDHTIQKLLRTQPAAGGKLYEIRMAQKKRLYIMVGDTKGSAPLRVVIVGESSTEDGQSAYISRLVA